VQEVNLTADELVTRAVLPFWQAVLDYREKGPDDLVDPHRRGPTVWFQQIAGPPDRPQEQERQQRNRIHVDIAVPHDQADD
jgi:4a-hydroxytetrahydrobiopterin dehydratase